MKIVRVSVVSPDNRYGGLTTVALIQCRALTASEHDVTLPAVALTRLYGIRYDVQTYEMIHPCSRLMAMPLDAAQTRRVLRGAERCSI